ncbi:MAG TPA: 30S ribosome-binding factor RbfA [Candidatus Kapabacteria bacterium]|nr:30S ribosome-binding factor RbfA [Candidatus Kapabacteria bacterium]
MSVRTERVSGEIQKIVSAIISRDHSDLSDGLMTVTEVDVSPDLRNAKVYVSILGGKMAHEKTIRQLNDRMHQIRGELGHEIRLRHIPELQFYIDASSAHAARISELINEWHEKQQHEDGDNNE